MYRNNTTRTEIDKDGAEISDERTKIIGKTMSSSSSFGIRTYEKRKEKAKKVEERKGRKRRGQPGTRETVTN